MWLLVWYLNSPPSVEYIAKILTSPKIKIEKTKDYKKTFVNLVGQLINEPLRLEDMGKNALEATGYAQLRADEASEYLLSILKSKWNNYVFYTWILV